MAQWKTYNGEVINVGNRDLPAGYYRFRVRGQDGKGDSIIVDSPAFHYSAPVAPQPPTNLSVNNENKTLTFTLNPDYTELSDYQYSTNGGLTWGVVEELPLQLANMAYYPGDILVKVSSRKHPVDSLPVEYGEEITISYTHKPTPDKPDNLVLDTETREFTWDIAGGLSVGDYEWCMRGSSKFPKIQLGTEVWRTCTSNPQPVITGLPIKPDSLSVRVKETPVNNPGFQATASEELPLKKKIADIPTMLIDEDIRTIRFNHPLGVYDLGIGLDFSTFLGRREIHRYQIGNESVAEGKWRAGFVGARYVDQANSPVVISPAFDAKAPINPPPPRVYTDTLNKKVSATSPFQIEVSTNNEPYVDYSGPITVNTSAPQGHYKFRVKQQTYVNNSEVTESGVINEEPQPPATLPLNLNNISL